MGKFVVLLLMIFAASLAIFRYATGDKRAFSDDFSGGSVVLLVGILGGVVLATWLPNFLLENGIIDRSLWMLGLCTAGTFLLWFFLVSHIVSRLTPKN